MPYQDPNTRQWYDDYGIPMNQAAEGQPGSYLPGYGAYGNASTDPYTGQPITDGPGQPWTDYQNGYGAPGSTPQSPSPSQPDIGTAASGMASTDAGTGGTAPSLGPFTDMFAPPQMRPMPGLPGITPVPAFNFKAPSAQSALDDPGYQFRRNEGLNGLQRWAAARGTLNDSGTANALSDYAENAASQEYNNVWNREWQSQTAAFAPQLAQWSAQNDRSGLGFQTQTAWNQHANDEDYINAWNAFRDREDLWKFNVQQATQLAGM